MYSWEIVLTVTGSFSTKHLALWMDDDDVIDMYYSAGGTIIYLLEVLRSQVNRHF